MAYHYDVARDDQGRSIGGATVSVYHAGTTTAASIYSDSDLGTAKANPFTAGTDGFFDFFVLPGTYKLRVEKIGSATLGVFEVDNVQIGSTNDVLNAQDFGAKGDGSTDDAPALNAALAASANKTLFIPSGTYLLGSTLTVPAFANVRGAGRGNAILKRNQITARAITLSADATLSGLTVDGSWDTLATHTRSEINAGARAVVRDVEVKNFWYQGITVNGVADVLIADCVVIGNNDGTLATGGAEFGIWADSASNSNLLISRCLFSDMRTVAIWMGGVNGAITDCRFRNNHVQTTPVTGGQLGVGGTGKNILIANNVLEAGGAGASGIETGPFGSEDLLIIGNVVDDQPNWGIILQDPQANVQVIGNYVEGCGQDGIRVQGDHSEFQIIGNRCRSNTGWGCRILAGTSDNYIVTGNDFRGNTAGGLQDGGTGTSKVVANNLPTGSVSARVQLSAVQAIATATNTDVSWGTEVYDYSGLFDAGTPTRLTAPVRGVYLATAGTQWPTNATGDRQIRVRVNGSSSSAVQRGRAASTGNSYQSVSAALKLEAGDYVTLDVNQDSGVSLDLQANPATFLSLDLLKAV